MVHLAREGIEHLQLLDFVVVERNADRLLRVLGREHVDHVAAHAEGAAAEIELASRVLHRHETREDIALRHLLALPQVQDHAVVFRRIADTVDARHGRHDDHVAPLEQRLRRRQAHLFDVVVDGRVLLDVKIARRYVRFRLVIVVIRNEVFDRIVREELAKLGVELRGERLVRREHERRPPRRAMTCAMV